MTRTLLLGAAALHLGFQATITLLVYPALARIGPDRWRAEHDRHSRAITPLVIVVYGLLVLACGAAVISSPGLPVLVAVAGAAVSLGVTATTAAPLHGRLTSYDAGLLTRLLRADRARLAGALLCTAAALLAAL